MDVPQAISELTSPDAAKRAAAAETLAHLETGAQSAALHLVRCIADQDESVREWTTAALESLGPPAAKDTSALAQLLSEKNADVAYWSATLLGRLESTGAAAIPQLTTALESHSEIAVRERAAWALGQIGPAANAALPALQRAAADPRPRLSRLAKEAVAKIQPA